MLTFRPLTRAEISRRTRTGKSDPVNSRKGVPFFIGEETRNGLPEFRPYVWRGQHLEELRARLDAEYEAAP